MIVVESHCGILYSKRKNKWRDNNINVFLKLNIDHSVTGRKAPNSPYYLILFMESSEAGKIHLYSYKPGSWLPLE